MLLLTIALDALINVIFRLSLLITVFTADLSVCPQWREWSWVRLTVIMLMIHWPSFWAALATLLRNIEWTLIGLVLFHQK